MSIGMAIIKKQNKIKTKKQKRIRVGKDVRNQKMCALLV